MKRRSRVKTAIATVSQRPTIPGKPASQLRLWKAGPSAVFPRPKKKKKYFRPSYLYSGSRVHSSPQVPSSYGSRLPMLVIFVLAGYSHKAENLVHTFTVSRDDSSDS